MKGGGAGSQEPPGAVPNARANGPTGVPPLDLEVAVLSDTGRARSNNEDFLDHFSPKDPQQLATKGSIYLVADGMGGYQAGEVASHQAVQMVIEQYYGDATHDVGTSLVRAFRNVNRMIHEQAQADPAKAGMGTTLVAAVIRGRQVYIANVGDSRAYLVGRAGIAQITEDHSWVQEQFRAGLLTPEQARAHPQRNVVTRALGSRPAVDVDLFEGQINDGDMLLLCTDGLSGMVDDRDLEAIVRSQPPKEAVQSLIAAANEHGGTDNVTVLMVTARRETPAVAATAPMTTIPAARRTRGRPLWPILLAVIAVLALAAAGLFVIRPMLAGGETATPTAPAPTATAPVLQSPISTPTPLPGIATATNVPVSQATTGEATPAPPTVTLAPSRTPTLAPPAGATQAPATATRQPDVLLTFPAPVLQEPKEINAGSLRGVVTFRWSYGTALQAGQAFQVLMWKDGQTEHAGAAGFTRELEQDIDLDRVLADRGGPGLYQWSVVLVQESTGQRLSPEASPWKFVYTERAGPAANPTPTDKPISMPTPQITPMTLPTMKPLPTIGPLTMPPLPTVGWPDLPVIPRHAPRAAAG